MTSATFFLTTGRCGTQSLAHHLRQFYSDRAKVEHEPIRAGYRPKFHLRSQLDSTTLAASPRVARHIEEIEGTLESRDYIEVGWPSFAWAPFLYRRLNGRARFVHLVRNPVRVALSLTTHGFYQPEKVNNEYTDAAQLDPFTAGTRFRGYASRWKELTPYEKCLFQWLEINTFALEVGRAVKASQFRTFRFEDLVQSGDASGSAFLEFLGLPLRDEFISALQSHPVDAFGWVTDEIADWRLVFDHPDVVKVARNLGYDLRRLSERKLRRRYSPKPRPIARRMRRLPSALSQKLRAALLRLRA